MTSACAGAQVRLSGADLAKFQAAEEDFGNVKTEHAFNGLGILDKVKANNPLSHLTPVWGLVQLSCRFPADVARSKAPAAFLPRLGAGLRGRRLAVEKLGRRQSRLCAAPQGAEAARGR